MPNDKAVSEIEATFKKDSVARDIALYTFFTENCQYFPREKDTIYAQMKEYPGMYGKFLKLKFGDTYLGHDACQSQFPGEFTYTDFGLSFENIQQIFRWDKEAKMVEWIKGKLTTLLPKGDTVNELVSSFYAQADGLQSLASQEDITADMGGIDLSMFTREKAGLATHIPCLDEALSGMVVGELTIVAAAAGNGKTLLAQHLTSRAMLEGWKTVFLTTEISKEINSVILLNSLAYRKKCAVDTQKMRRNALSEKDVETLQSMQFPGSVNFVNASLIKNWSLRNLSDLIGDAKLVVLDFFQNCDFNETDEFKKRERGNEVVQLFKEISEGKDGKGERAVVLISKVNKEAEKRVINTKDGAGLYCNSDLSDYSNLSFLATNIIFLYKRPKFTEMGKVGIALTKSRWGISFEYPQECNCVFPYRVLGDDVLEVDRMGPKYTDDMKAINGIQDMVGEGKNGK